MEYSRADLSPRSPSPEIVVSGISVKDTPNQDRLLNPDLKALLLFASIPKRGGVGDSDRIYDPPRIFTGKASQGGDRRIHIYNGNVTYVISSYSSVAPVYISNSARDDTFTYVGSTPETSKDVFFEHGRRSSTTLRMRLEEDGSESLCVSVVGATGPRLLVSQRVMEISAMWPLSTLAQRKKFGFSAIRDWVRENLSDDTFLLIE